MVPPARSRSDEIDGNLVVMSGAGAVRPHSLVWLALDTVTSPEPVISDAFAADTDDASSNPVCGSVFDALHTVDFWGPKHVLIHARAHVRLLTRITGVPECRRHVPTSP